MTTPVALIAFKRPELTRRTLEAIRAQQPTELFLIQDAPRPGNADDEAGCAGVRDVLESVDWPCTVHQRYAETNLGCEASVELGLDWVFSQVEEAIIFEDDCVPDPSFFPFVTELLERYRDDDRVWHVAGNSHWVSPRTFGERSYDFSTWASVWGWATWRRAWQAHRAVFPRTHEPGDTSPRRVGEQLPRPDALVTVAGRKHFEDVAGSRDGEEYGWDSHWWITLMTQGRLSATPRENLVENDGFGEGATHTRSSRPVTPAEPTTFPLVHPEAVALNEAVERELELVLLRANGRLARAARKIIRPLWMRGIIRRVVTAPATTALLRFFSRMRSGLHDLQARSGGAR